MWCFPSTVLFVYLIIFPTWAQINQLCTTPKGTIGICIRKELCPSIMRLDKNNNIIDKEYINKSVCIYDDNIVGYFCCEYKQVNTTDNYFTSITNKTHPGFLEPKQEREVKTERICQTPNKTDGICIQSKECPYLHMLNGANLTPEQLDFAKNSVCGVDLDKTILFCCDKRYISRSEDRGIPDDDIKVNIPQAVEESPSWTKVPILPNKKIAAASIQSIPSSLTSEQKVVPCETPNGEKAQCVSIYQCSNIVNNLSANTSEYQKRFIKESSCGFNNGTPLVCCGSDSNYRRSIDTEKKIPFEHNPLIPSGYCGIQDYRAEVQNPIITNRQRLVDVTKTMNFTLPNRIFGGINSEIGEFPWIAILVYETYDGKRMFGCGGSLISSRYVLTAAHCVSGPNIRQNKLTGIRLGEWDYSHDGADCITEAGRTVCNEAEITIGVESIHLYPTYRSSTVEKYDDIALIRLDKEIKFTRFVSPICLPNMGDYVSPGERLFISGWGLKNYDEETTIKQKVQVPIVSRSQCSIMFEKSPRLTSIGKGQFCAGGEPGKDACVGDSGAPLMRKGTTNSTNPDPWYVEGIVSFGRACGLANQYGVYTKVSEYLPWIHSTVVA